MTAKLYCGDCLKLLPDIESGSIDAIITDLPYGTTACSWDTVIPFAPMWAEVKRILKPKGAFVTTASQPFTSALVMSNLKWFRQELIWDKVLPVGFLDANRKHMRIHENIILFAPAGHTTYNPEMTIRGMARGKGNAQYKETIVYGKYKQQKSHNNHYYPTTILKFSNGDRTRPEVGYHPTQKSVALYQYLIATYTNAGDTVMDFCMGSGTTGVAAMKLGRSFVGMELRKDYFAIAQRRIEQAEMQPALLQV